jgi:hypothetical protein
MTVPYIGDDRRQPAEGRRYIDIIPECGKPSNCGHLDDIYARLEQGDKRMTHIESSITANTEATLEARDILVAAKGAFKVLGWLGVVFKWVGGISTAAVAIYVAFYVLTHGGKLPGGGME